MRTKSQAASEQKKEVSKRTPTFLLELPLQVSVGQAGRLRAHLEAGRQFYNAVLSEGLKRLRRMRADPAQAGLPVLSLALRSRNGPEPLRSCASSTVFPSTPCTRQGKRYESAGWPIT